MSKSSLRRIILSIAASALLVTTAQSQDRYLWNDFGLIGKNSDRHEIQFGLLSYDTGLFTHQDFNGAVLNGELLFPSPDFLYRFGSPRPHIGFDAALVDDPIHFLYAGLTWDTYFTDRLYLTTSLGGGITTADNLENPTDYKALGCRALFHLGAGIGYDFTPNLTFQLYADHFSNAGLCSPNNGAEAAGIRFGYRF